MSRLRFDLDIVQFALDVVQIDLVVTIGSIDEEGACSVRSNLVLKGSKCSGG